MESKLVEIILVDTDGLLSFVGYKDENLLSAMKSVGAKVYEVETEEDKVEELKTDVEKLNEEFGYLIS